MHTKKHHPKKRNILFLRTVVPVLCLLPALAGLPETVLARTYTITDGDSIVTYTTFATDPADILEEAGLGLGESDSFTTQGGTDITVCRAQRVTVLYHGEEIQAVSDGETVDSLLSRLGLGVSEADTLSHAPDTPTFDGMCLRVDRILTRQETYTAALPHDTAYCAAPSLAEGQEAVLLAGKDGEFLCTANVTYCNGREVSREILTQTQTQAPVTEIIGTGTAPAPRAEPAERKPVIGDGYILLPTGEMLTYTRTDTVQATGYTHTDAGCDRITSTGTTVHYGTVAVDPRFIPYGTRMFLVSQDGEYYYGIAVAEDCGGAIKRDRMDLYFPTYEECIQFGRRRCTIYFLG